MRLAIVSDIHGNLPALRAVIEDAGVVDGWLNLGDTVSGPLWPAETAAFLMARGWPTIAGNHERQILTQPLAHMGASDRHAAERLSPAQRAWLAALPATLTPVPGLLCVHGTPMSDIECLLETVTPEGMRAALPQELAQQLAAAEADLVLCGHTHVPRQRLLDGKWVLNPGSVGLQAYDHDQPFDHVVENGTPHARYAIVQQHGRGWAAELRTVTYDHEAAARQAEAAGFGHWADALRTGRVGRRERDVLG
jgi:predicted phosphodiesterase